MGVPKRKMSKMKVRTRKAANRYKGVEVYRCTKCSAPIQPHRACAACGNYNGKQVLTVEQQ